MIDYTKYLRETVADMVTVCSELSHVKLRQLAFSFVRAKSTKRNGLLASLTPLRFEDGQTVTSRRGVLYQIPQLVIGGVEMLYIVSFVYPRFLDLSFEQKTNTIIHELWHISEKFDGDIRRYPGRTFAHSGRKSKFDEEVEAVATKWLQRTSFSLDVLKLNSTNLIKKYEKVVGQKVTKPRLVRLP
ncbi:MAG TPA: putative metallopeptidase [Caldisericia bacterium]|nr:putative metallopeptidase [Caldisericia bacterium]HPF49639.1 putative metallopeptidase [Caldisericia bacterium]HPI84621.1 putative metallopeptidase [Caldisericia bacterium]HPQ92169.1 putative metallopeptidase [Caldisericia bacterium]HRV74733.1 putative metallopeptidase [Caldisericia bacterium]